MVEHKEKKKDRGEEEPWIDGMKRETRKRERQRER